MPQVPDRIEMPTSHVFSRRSCAETRPFLMAQLRVVSHTERGTQPPCEFLLDERWAGILVEQFLGDTGYWCRTCGASGAPGFV